MIPLCLLVSIVQQDVPMRITKCTDIHYIVGYENMCQNVCTAE